MKTAGIILMVLLHGISLAADKNDGRHVTFTNPEKGVAWKGWAWVPVTLKEDERKLLEKRSDPPMAALDYYLLLPGKYFGKIKNSVDRRITYIDREFLSDQFLHAEYAIPSVDAGDFEVTIRVFESDGEPLIAIRHRGGNKLLHKVEDERGVKAGEIIWITLGRPDFWRYRNGKWISVDAKILPGITKEFVIDKYRNHFKDHLKNPTQKKTIALGYDLPRTGGIVRVTRITKFGSKRPKKVWAEFTFDGVQFAPTADSEKGDADQPAAVPESMPGGNPNPEPESKARPQ
ncbi:hypothetical protein N9195_00165 [bacterium]|nr:hypothetical protein [bacterium]